jgi:hypothetical protein
LEEDSRDLREDYPCNYISALTKSRGKIQPWQIFFFVRKSDYVPAEYISEL